MATNGEIIRDAMSLIGIVGHGQSLPAEEAKLGLRMLNAMLSAWEADGVVQYVEARSTSDEFAFSPDMDLAATSNLVLLLAPHYGAAIPPSVAVTASVQYRRLLDRAVSLLIEPSVPQLPGSTGRAFDADDE